MAPADENPFSLEPAQPTFECLANDNGFKFWLASDLARLLGYEDLAGFRKSVERAMQVCISLDIPCTENIIPVAREVEGRSVNDFRLSRFACYLAAMNGDPRKPEVARAQAYFVTFAEACRVMLERSDGVERVAIRGDLRDRDSSLRGVAHQAGVTEFGLFQNSGYRGLYNMDISRLRDVKGIPGDRTPLDFMGKAELAANLFRITQTEERIRNQNIHGQGPCEKAAFAVGRTVRDAMQQSSGMTPEALPPAEDIKQVQKKIKATNRGFRKIDKAKPPKSLPPGAKGRGGEE